MFDYFSSSEGSPYNEEIYESPIYNGTYQLSIAKYVPFTTHNTLLIKA